MEVLVVKKDDSEWMRLYVNKKLMYETPKYDPVQLLKIFQAMGVFSSVGVFETSEEQLKEFTEGAEEFLYL